MTDKKRNGARRRKLLLSVYIGNFHEKAKNGFKNENLFIFPCLVVNKSFLVGKNCLKAMPEMDIVYMYLFVWCGEQGSIRGMIVDSILSVFFYMSILNFVFGANPIGVTPRRTHKVYTNLNNFSTTSLIFDLKMSIDRVYQDIIAKQTKYHKKSWILAPEVSLKGAFLGWNTDKW